MRLSVFTIVFIFTLGNAASSDVEENRLSEESLIRSWRTEKVAVEDIAADYCKRHRVFLGDTKCDNNSITRVTRWKEFISRYRKGDEVWFYKSPPRTWEALMGREGYAIFRGDKLIEHITTRLN